MSGAPAHVILWPEEEYQSHEAGLKRLRARRWRPRCVYDIGASTGFWTDCASKVFPLAEYHLFEPLATTNEAYRAGLLALQAQPGVRIKIHPVALDDSGGTRLMGVPADPMGSSLLVTEVTSYFPRVVEVEATTLDAYRTAHQLRPPDLIKIDTQGAELRILNGAHTTLGLAELVLIETWLERGYGDETPLLHEMVAWLHQRGFHAIDAFDGYREGSRLVAFDLLFARQDLVLDR